MTHFPSPEGPTYAASRALVPWRDHKDHKASFRVYRWKGNEDDQCYTFPTKAWLANHSFPLRHWNHNDITSSLQGPLI